MSSNPSAAAMEGRAPAAAIAIAVSLGLLWSVFSGDLLRPVLRPLLPQAAVAVFPYLGSALISLIDIALMLLMVALAARRSPLQLLRLGGLYAAPGRPLVWALLWLLPALCVCLLWGQRAQDLGVADLVWKGLLGPFSEELFYRGLAVAALVRLCGWRWWIACLWPALFFGAVHAGQGADLGSVAGIVAITALGALLFGWLLVRWDFNLWPPVLLHVGLNSLFLVFAWGESAVFGGLGGAVRIGVVLIAVLAALRMQPPLRR